jgi:N-acetylglucosamine-6-phosphate deacetylase
MKTIALTGATIAAPFSVIEQGTLVISKGKIKAVGKKENVLIPEEAEVVDVSGMTLVPGFIDLHIHGGSGVRASDGVEAIGKMAAYLPSTGTTSWLPSVGSIEAMRYIVAAAKEKPEGAEIIGIHMEGPYLAPKNLPGTDHEEPKLPNLKEYEEMLEAGEGLFRLMGLAPELDGALDLIREMNRTGVVAAVAHSKATYDQLMRAVEAGLKHVTHSYNVMTGFHHRKPGVVGAVLTCDALTAELIGDGFHVHPAAMDILIRCKGANKVAIITDNTAHAGLPDGVYGNVEKKDGIIRRVGFTQETDGTMMGSPWPMDHNFRTVMKATHRSMQEMVAMTSTVPALVAGVINTKGTLEVGKDADITALDSKGEVEFCIVGGKIAYNRRI